MATVKKAAPASSLLDLPFDQYSRQYTVTELINNGLRKGAERFTIIDLGGHKGKTQDFLPKDTVTILDVFEETYPGYVQGDATDMTFEDDAFDLACSFDVFEHIPRSSRLAFVNEALRVSRRGVFIAMPVDPGDGSVAHAEEVLNDIHKKLYGQNHRWLKEHIDYRIPTYREVERLLQKTGATFVAIPGNQITDWQLLQTVIFAAAQNYHITDTSRSLNRWYNQHIRELENGVNPGYRGIYFVSRDPGLVERMRTVAAALFARPSPDNMYLQVHQSTLEQTLRAVATIGKEFTQLLHVENAYISLQEDHRALVTECSNVTQHTRELQAQVDAMRQSLSWKITAPLRKISGIIRGAKG